MKKPLLFPLITIAFSILIGCSAVDDLKDTLDAAECAALIDRINDNDNENCADAIADINKIERSCGEFLSAASREQIALLKANCEDN